MRRFSCSVSSLFIAGVVMAALSVCSHSQNSYAGTKTNPKVLLKTSMGDVTIELDAKKAPISVKNFLAYVKSGHYADTIFHRVIPGFMIQGGGFMKDMSEKAAQPPIKNEAGNGLKNLTGTLAMARTNVVDSASAQFFINVKDNAFLDHRDDTPQGFGYAVFGKVIKGMEVVTKIEGVPTATRGMNENVPVDPVTIVSVKLLK